VNLTLVLITAFMLKHFLADFVLQTPYQVANKGTLGHPGGLIHVGIHLLLTLLVLSVCLPLPLVLMLPLLFMILVGEACIHYTMDWCKSNIVHMTGWTASDPVYWWLTGFDQLVHGLTYVGIVAALT
jgi:hypothetical protein